MLSKPVRTWPQFAKQVRSKGHLLAEFDRFYQPIFVSGCQRSGGTMLANAFTQHAAIADFAWSKDAELDAGLLLSGAENPRQELAADQRLCFQTTYLNENYTEYFALADRLCLIWLIRNPHSVVYSMVYNWSSFALTEVFEACGLRHVKDQAALPRNWRGKVRPIVQACYAYVGKARQCLDLHDRLPATAFHPVAYEDLVTNKAAVLKQLLSFAGLSTQDYQDDTVHSKSMSKSARLSDQETAMVTELCDPVYAELQALLKPRCG